MTTVGIGSETPSKSSLRLIVTGVQTCALPISHLLQHCEAGPAPALIWNAPLTLDTRDAERSDPDSTNEVGIERSCSDTPCAIRTAGAAADKYKLNPPKHGV